jgi:hypothetical protein
MFQAINIRASVNIVFRWICQIKIAPYSYDWIDNAGRQSPRKLIPGIERLEIGKNFLVGRIVEFDTDRHITGVIHPKMALVFGSMSFTYAVRSTSPASCRLVVKINVGAHNWMERLRRIMLAWGDLIMMRKQLLTIKSLAESE